jgi:hypothetical protein
MLATPIVPKTITYQFPKDYRSFREKIVIVWKKCGGFLEKK